MSVKTLNTFCLLAMQPCSNKTLCKLHCTNSAVKFIKLVLFSAIIDKHSCKLLSTNKMVGKQFSKHRREYPVKRWTESETVAILTYMQNNRIDNEYNEKLTARDYYNTLLNETKIAATWNLVKFKVRHLKLSFERAEALRNSIGCGDDIDSQKEIQEQIHKLCPHYKQLSDIFSDAKKSTAGRERQLYYSDESLLSCVKQELHVDDNTISEFVDEEPSIENTMTSAFVTQEPCPVITSNNLTDQSQLEKTMAYDQFDPLGTHFATKTKQPVVKSSVTQKPCPAITSDDLTQQSLLEKTMAHDRCDPLGTHFPTKTKQPVVEALLAKLSAIDSEKTKYEECMLSLEREKFHWNKQIEKRNLKLKKKRMKMEFQMRQMEMEQKERLFKLELQMKYNNQNSIYK